MKNFKLSRNIWLFAGVCFLLSLIAYIADNSPVYLLIINGLTCILSFVNAYMFHKKIKEENK